MIENMSLIRQKADQLQRTSLSGTENNSFSSRYGIKLMSLVAASILVVILDKGFSSDFVSFASTVLSILIGLFITAVIFSFDKFYEPKTEGQSDLQSLEDEARDIQSFNYTKQFSYITGYNIILCIVTIVLLGISALFPTTSEVLLHKQEFLLLSDMQFKDIIYTGKLILLVSQRIAVVYFLIRIIHNTLFVVSSMVNYMIVKIERGND